MGCGRSCCWHLSQLPEWGVQSGHTGDDAARAVTGQDHRAVHPCRSCRYADVGAADHPTSAPAPELADYRAGEGGESAGRMAEISAAETCRGHQRGCMFTSRLRPAVRVRAYNSASGPAATDSRGTSPGVRAAVVAIERRCAMTLGFLFWLIMVLWALFGAWGIYPSPNKPPFVPFLGIGLTFVLFFLLGWRVFGFVIQG